MMRTMVRFMTQLLVVSLLTLNIAWSVDVCAFTDPEPAGNVLLQSDDQSPNSPNASLDCDDWCHAWVTHIALTRSMLTDVNVLVTISGDSYQLFCSSLAIPPPFHPPIA